MLLFTIVSFTNAQVQSELSKNIFAVNNYIVHSFSPENKPAIGPFLDSVFTFCKKVTGNNPSEALLLATLSVIPYDTVPIKMPFGSYIGYPLPGVDMALFHSKVKALPSSLFINSPNNSFGDKDKIAHFFASAYFSFAVSEKVALYLGALVEHFEYNFVVSGTIDERDLKVNECGAAFGNSLKKDPGLLPAHFLPALLK